MERKILHVDMNNFYASVELLTRPDLRDKAVIVGGDASQRHGIVLAKNEIAKSFGVQTAETIYQAKQKCPHAVFLQANHKEYRKYSDLSRKIYLAYTERMEPFGPDEAWLDLSHRPEPLAVLANGIRARIKQDLHLQVSVGASWNKTFAKMGSDYKKPDAYTVITKENYQDLLWPLPVGRLLYVGEVSERKLSQIQIYTIGDLAKADPALLRQHMGNHALHLQENALGNDQAIVTTAEERGHQKSIGAMETSAKDLFSEEEIRSLFSALAKEVSSRAKAKNLEGTTVSIQVKFSDFKQFSRQRTLSYVTNAEDTIFQIAMDLFLQHFWPLEKGVRLLGISLENVEDDSRPKQMMLEDVLLLEEKVRDSKQVAKEEALTVQEQKSKDLETLLSKIQEEMGENSIRRGFPKSKKDSE